jgi:hypothetical protein
MLIIIYMSYGMTSLPLGMIRGRSQIHAERASVEEQVTFQTKLKFYHPTHSPNGVLDFNILPQIEIQQRQKIIRNTKCTRDVIF